MSHPLVSVVVAAFNEEVRIGECLASLKAQTYDPIEILVGDDGSHDRTAEVASSFAGVDVRRFPHKGKGPTINALVERARGEILVFADADIIYEKNYVVALVAPIVSGACIGTSHATEYVANPENRWSRCLQAQCGLPPNLRLQMTEEEMARGTPVFRAIRRAVFVAQRGFEDTGFLDDQSLAPKVRELARLVAEASCSHYNPETLGEVFARGRWCGKSVFLRFGARGAIRSVPPFSWLRAARAAGRNRMWALLPYKVVEDTGIALGVFENFVASRSKHAPSSA